jgi:hypothetical protein
MYAGSARYYDVCGGPEENKYIFPQMILEYLRFPEKTGQPIWNLTEAMIGVS